MNAVQIEQKSYEMPPREGISIAQFLTVTDIERSARYYEDGPAADPTNAGLGTTIVESLGQQINATVKKERLVEGYTVTVIVPQAKEPFIPSAVADIHCQSGKGDRERGHASERADRFKQHQTGESGANVTRRRGEQATLDQAWNEGSGPEFPYGDIASPHPPDWGRDLHLCRFNFSTRMALPTSRMG